MSPRKATPSSLARIQRIHGHLREGRALRLVDLAAALEVTPRTLKRDIELMRTQWNAPIEWEPVQRTYFYSRPFEELPLLRVTADEALALRLAGNTFAAWGDSALGRALQRVLGKIGTVLGNSLSVPFDDLGDCLTEPALGPEAEREQHWLPDLVRALREHRVCTIAYHSPGKPIQNRVIHPLHLAHLDGRWVCIALDPNRDAVRHFLLTRMEALHLERATFRPPAAFDARRHLAGSFGRFTGEELHRIRLRFDPVALPYLRERRWHPSQHLVETADGAAEVQFRLNSLVDIRRWVLSWGSRVEVLDPPALREQVADELRQALAKYRSGPA